MPLWPFSPVYPGWGNIQLSYFNAIWKFFTSVTLSVVLLLTLAATSIIGTFIPQNKTPDEYYSAFGDFLYRFYSMLDFYDMYASPWFRALLLLIVINIIVCSIERLSATWKIIFVKTPKFNVSRFRRLANGKEFTIARSSKALIERYEPIATKGFEYSRVEETDNGYCIFAEKGRLSRLGVYTVHVSIVLLLLGALIGSIYGFNGYVNITEGDTVNSMRFYDSDRTQRLPFKVRCDKFDVTYYDTGQPKEFRSKLTILEDNKPVKQKEIIVNDPLRYKGINLFQSSYGKSEAKGLTLNFKIKATGKTYAVPVKIAEVIDVPEGLGKFRIKGFRNSYPFRGQDLGESFFGTYTTKDGKSTRVTLPTRYPTFDAQVRRGEFSVWGTDHDYTYFTGLQVTKDPGVWVVYAGFIVILIGCYITFFMSHQQICIEVSKASKKSRVRVSGTANKNGMGMDRKVEKLAARLEALGEGA